MTRRNKAGFIVFILVLVAIWASGVIMREKIEMLASKPKTAIQISQEELRIDGTFYERVFNMGKKYNLDLSFVNNMQRVVENTSETQTIFQNLSGDFDAIIFADSTFFWGISPQILEEITKKNIALVGFAGAFPSKNFIRAAESISKNHLKKHGRVFFMFAEDNWGQDPNGIQCSEVMRSFAKEDIIEKSAADTKEQNLFVSMVNDTLKMPQVDLYSNILLPTVAPSSYRQLLLGVQDYILYLWRKDMSNALVHCPKAVKINLKNKYNRKNFRNFSNVALNIKNFASSNLPNKVLILPWVFSSCLDNEVQSWSSQYTIINLPEIMSLQYGCSTIDVKTGHIANESAIEGSVVFAMTVKNLLVEQ